MPESAEVAVGKAVENVAAAALLRQQAERRARLRVPHGGGRRRGGRRRYTWAELLQRALPRQSSSGLLRRPGIGAAPVRDRRPGSPAAEARRGTRPRPAGGLLGLPPDFDDMAHGRRDERELRALPELPPEEREGERWLSIRTNAPRTRTNVSTTPGRTVSCSTTRRFGMGVTKHCSSGSTASTKPEGSCGQTATEPRIPKTTSDSVSSSSSDSTPRRNHSG